MGRIDPAFLGLPPEVLTASMRTHQRYFALENADGTLAPHFIVVANTLADDGGRAIIAGNERVLRARLSDAKYFWDLDRKTKLEERVPKLAEITFHARLGSMGERVTRLQTLAAELAEFIPGCDRERARSAALLCKADLLTGMVGEFPELQGIMGRYYALAEGEAPDVADAIAEHYAPRGPDDRTPTAPVSVALALAEKIDTLVGMFAIGEKPTGSRDPFALRRAALGVIRLVLHHGLRLKLRGVFESKASLILSHLESQAAPDLYSLPQSGTPLPLRDAASDMKKEKAKNVAIEVLDFIGDRLKVHLKGEGVPHDQVAAVFALGDDDLVRVLARVRALGAFLKSDDGTNLLIAYRRAANIVRIEEKKDSATYSGSDYDPAVAEAEEAVLWRALGDMELSALLAKEQFEAAMGALAKLRRPVDAFFDKVTVNVPDAALRRNRLRLLARITAVMNRAADFARLEG
jgi:glycyl-tRNA synthetase beta chain